MKIPSLRQLLVIVAFVSLLAFGFSFVADHIGAPATFLLIAALAMPAPSLVLGAATLTSQQILLDIIKGFRKWFPGFGMLGTEFRGEPLKLNQRYTAHIPTIPSTSTYDPTTGYANGATNARSLLVDVDVVVNKHPTAPLKWLHLDQIKDIKQKWDECMSLAGYALAKAAVDGGIFAKMTGRYFTQEYVTTVANFDYDVLAKLTTLLNQKGAAPIGRILFVNSDVAEVLSVDNRMISKDYDGQILGGNGYRQWRNKGGFALIQEYPDLPTNNGAQLTGVTGANSGDIMTKVAHGLVTADPVTFISGTTFTGLTAGTRYFAIRSSADTFQVALTRADAIAGTAIALAADGTAGVFQKQENLVAFAGDMRAFSYLAGMPDGMDNDFAAALGIPKVMAFDKVIEEESGMPLAAAKWQVPGTADFFWVPTFVYGTNAGKEGSSALPTNTDDANSILAAANLIGTTCDYAGLRVSLGASA